jgi:hypothetical protein
MSDQTLTVEKLTPHVGAAVHGVDLSRPLDEPRFTSRGAATAIA